MIQKKLIHRLLPSFAVLMAAFMLVVTSCSEQDAVSPSEEPGAGLGGMLYMSLAVSAANGAETVDGYEEGQGWENVIDIAHNNYRIYFFDTKGYYLAPFVPMSLDKEPEYVEAGNGESTGTYVYNMFGQIPSEVGKEFKLVVLGNWRSYPAVVGDWQLVKGETTIRDLCAAAGAQYTHLAPNVAGEWLSEERLIPFYGVREYNVENYVDKDTDLDKEGRLKGQTTVDLKRDPIPMLRAVARVEVIVEAPFTELSDVTMDRVNDKGFCGPENAVYHTDYDHRFDWDNDFIRNVHLVNNGNNDAAPQPLAFTKIGRTIESDGKVIPEKWLAYVPEYRNIGVGDGYCAIRLKLKGDIDNGISDNEKKLYFANYKEGKTDNANDVRLNIERNNIYRFTITQSSSELLCEVDVQPYAECKLEYDYGLMRDERGDLKVLPDDNGALPEFFVNYLKAHPDMEPKVLDDKGNETTELLEPQHQIGDYYAIIRSAEGTVESIWIKDADECRVITNFAKKDDNNEDCSTRKVWRFLVGTGLNEEKEEGYKDRDGEWRLQHHTDHSSIVYDVEGQMIFKPAPDDEAGIRYLVESWENDKKKNPQGLFWYIKAKSKPYEKEVEGEKKTYIEYTFQQADNTGKNVEGKDATKTWEEEVIEKEKQQTENE